MSLQGSLAGVASQVQAAVASGNQTAYALAQAQATIAANAASASSGLAELQAAIGNIYVPTFQTLESPVSLFSGTPSYGSWQTLTLSVPSTCTAALIAIGLALSTSSSGSPGNCVVSFREDSSYGGYAVGNAYLYTSTGTVATATDVSAFTTLSDTFSFDYYVTNPGVSYGATLSLVLVGYIA